MVSSELFITVKNLILPAALIAISAGLLILRPKKFTGVILIFMAIIEYTYFFTKYQPFAPAKFVFPDHPVFEFLQKNAGPDRFFGKDFSYIDNNFATFYRVYSPEGYDPLYIRRYGELLAGSKDVPRSDAWINQEDEAAAGRALDLLGVKYFIDITDKPSMDTGQDFAKFPGDKYGFVKQVNKWKFYERRTALPRAFLAGNYEIIANGNSLERLYSPGFRPQETVLLETEPGIRPETGSGSAEIKSYGPNKIVIGTASEKPKLLFLSDNYYPGWKATVDGKEAPVLRADYSFRAIALEPGSHQVVFSYQPQIFSYGLVITLISLIVWAILLLLRY